ncbi:MAG: phytoene desaturase [Frankiaceae bacterium]|nr:phytoene desaturase [Frankiaceae bacterium]
MRRVSGRTDRVVVVGAGLGGLSAALRLAGSGREVVVVERDAVPGGRAGLLEIDGYRFDTGPTVLTMPELVEDALACVDETLGDWLDLRRLDPAYRAFFPDGSALDVVADVDAMAANITALSGSRDADGYRRFAAFGRALYDAERRDFIDRNLDSPLDLLRPSLARLVALGGFGRLGRKIASYVDDPRLRRVFSFQAMYAGLAPHEALALYAVIAYMDTVAGVWFPVGGMHAVPAALAGAADKHGVELRFGTEVTSVETEGARAVAVHTRDGERIPADVVVLNPDLPAALRLVGKQPPRQRPAPSCFLLLAGSTASYAGIAHHNLHFGAAWRRTFDEVIHRDELMSDPSLLVTSATVTDPGLAPTGRSTYAVLAPVPSLPSSIDWDVVGPRYRDEIVGRLEHAGYIGLGQSIEVEQVTTPADWARQGLAHGTPFSAAHTFRQTGPFRPGNLVMDNVVLVGCGTQPGVGVPMVLISGRLAAERIIGPGLR